jgi:hypothetical protein
VCGDNAMTFYFFLSESFFCLSKGQTWLIIKNTFWQ